MPKTKPTVHPSIERDPLADARDEPTGDPYFNEQVAAEPDADVEPEFDIKTALLNFANLMRSYSYRAKDGYYEDESERAHNATKREIYDNIADAMDSAFGIASEEPKFRG